jgi:hypothetical protein
MKAYSQDLRERVLADYDAKLGTWTIALKYKVSPSWIRRRYNVVGRVAK